MEEELSILTLRCETCDNFECSLARKYIPTDSLEGCTRRVSDLVHDQYQHYIEEVIPFWMTSKNQERVNQEYEEIISFLNNRVYAAPIGQKLDKRGKGVL